jgi:hypothetical protein
LDNQRFSVAWSTPLNMGWRRNVEKLRRAAVAKAQRLKGAGEFSRRHRAMNQ